MMERKTSPMKEKIFRTKKKLDLKDKIFKNEKVSADRVLPGPLFLTDDLFGYNINTII